MCGLGVVGAAVLCILNGYMARGKNSTEKFKMYIDNLNVK